MKRRDPLLWAALVAVLVVLASAEYSLAVACGFGPYVAAGAPAALDIYAVAALRARRDVLVVVAVLIAVNGASHLVAVELLPVNVPLVVSVSAIAPLVLWRVHRLGDAPDPEPEYAAAVERVPAPAEQAPVPRGTRRSRRRYLPYLRAYLRASGCCPSPPGPSPYRPSPSQPRRYPYPRPRYTPSTPSTPPSTPPRMTPRTTPRTRTRSSPGTGRLPQRDARCTALEGDVRHRAAPSAAHP